MDMSKVLPVLSLAYMNKVPIANDTHACKPFWHGNVLGQFLSEGVARGHPTVCSSSDGGRLPPCGFLLGGRKQISIQWSFFLKVIPHWHLHLSITLTINKGALNNHIHFGKVTKRAFPSRCPCKF